MQIKLTKEQLVHQKTLGLAIRVDGFKDGLESPGEAQIFIEVYEGILKVHVWNGTTDPTTINVDPED